MNGFTPDESESCRRLLELALAEDLGAAGDRTSRALIPSEQRGRAAFVARAAGVVAGLPAAAQVCATVNRELHFQPLVEDGTRVERDALLATVSGPLRSILAAERTALNFLQRL